MEDEEEETCPLCMEPMDVTDQAASLCDCGYSMCLWCWHQIVENAAKDSLKARCPNCRSEYDKERITNATVDPEKVKAAMQKKKEEKKKSKVITDRKALANVRVIQRNLVYVVGLSMHICREDALRKHDYFGQFGRIVKISVNRAGPYSTSSAKSSPTGSAYVTFVRNQDSLRCIEHIDGCTWDGHTVRACFGTTKYCNSFLKGIHCTNPDCLYLHDIAPEENDSFTKEQMLSRYGNQKSSNFFDLTHPQTADAGSSMMEMREMEMRESDNMRSAPQNIPGGMQARMSGQYSSNDGSWGAQGGAWGSPPPPPPPRGMGAPPGMGMGMPPGMGMSMGMGVGAGMGMGVSGHRRQSSGGGMASAGSGMASAGSGGFDGPSWGQVAAAGNSSKPPPPPPTQPAAQEEWPELGAGPKGPPGGPSMVKEASGSGKFPIFKTGSGLNLTPGGPKAKSELGAMLNGRSSTEASMETLGGVMVSKPPAGRAKAPGPPGASPAPGGNLSSPFLTAAGPQAPPQLKANSGMLTMTLPTGRENSGAPKPGSGKVAGKGAPPGFGPPSGSGPLRGPPPGFSGPVAGGAAALGNDTNDNDILNSLVESLKADLPPPSKAPVAAPGASDSGLAQALQGLEMMGEGLSGRTGSGANGQPPGRHAMPSLPPGFDVWSADVPPAYAGLATAAYNPMGLASQGDPSARYLLRNPPAAGSVGGGGASGATTGSGPPRGTGGPAAVDQSDSVASSGSSRSRSRFQFAQEDSKEGVSDPLWQGASGEGIPAAADVFQLLRQGNAGGGAAVKGAPPGFGGGPAEGAVPPGMALLQRLQMGASAAGGQSGPGLPPGFFDPAIVSRAGTAPGQQLSRPGSGAVRPPPGFGGGPQQPMFAGRGIDAVSGDSTQSSRWEGR